MAYKAKIVDMPDVKLMVSRADEFPSGIGAAWEKLESRLPSLKGRRFYGVTVCEGSELAYFAGVESQSDEEISSVGFPTMVVKGGKYARAKLLDWHNHRDEIRTIFSKLMRDFPMDRHGATVEFYRSQSELHLLIPLASSGD